MTWRSLLWRTLKVTVLRPYFQRRYRAVLRHIAQLEQELWPTVAPTNYTQVFSIAPGAIWQVGAASAVMGWTGNAHADHATLEEIAVAPSQPAGLGLKVP